MVEYYCKHCDKVRDSLNKYTPQNDYSSFNNYIERFDSYPA